MGPEGGEQQKPWEVCSLGGRRQVVWRLYPLQFPESMPTAMHVHLQLRIVGDDGTVITDSEILHLEKSDHQFEAVGLSISESKTLQKCLQQHVVTAQAAAFVNRHRCCPAVTCAAKESTRSSFAPCSAMSLFPVRASTTVAANRRTARPSAR